MLTRKAQQPQRGLSNQQKVKQIQKIIKIPLANLKTNIAESDLEQDDIEVPFCMKNQDAVIASLQKCNNKAKEESNKKKQYDQQKVNRTIRAMTTELFALNIEQEKNQNKHNKFNQVNVSGFTLQTTALSAKKQPLSTKSTRQLRQKMDNFFSCDITQEQSFEQETSAFNLRDVSSKFCNLVSITFVPPAKVPKPKKYQNRQTQPTCQDAPIQNSIRDLQLNSLKFVKRNEHTESYISKRFSRSKKGSQCDQATHQKQKFNRSNNKPKQIDSIIDKQNLEHFTYTNKKQLLTERSSYQNTDKRRGFGEAGLKGPNLINRRPFFKNEHMKERQEEIQNRRELLSQNYKKTPEIKQQISELQREYENLSKNILFEIFQRQQVNLTSLKCSNQHLVQFVKKVINEYKKSIDFMRKDS